MRKACLLFLFFICYSLVFGQNRPDRSTLLIKIQKSGKKERSIKVNITNSADADSVTRTLLYDFHRKGYLFASETLSVNSDTLVRVINTGNRVKAMPDTVFSDENVKLDILNSGKYYSQSASLASRNRIIENYENNGYPFARINADSLIGDSNTISFRYTLLKGPFIVNDSLVLIGDRVLKVKFLCRYLQIFPGRPYNESTYIQAEKKLRQLGFATVARKPDIWYGSDKAKMTVYLKKNSANSFQGIAGIVPPAGNEKRTIVTGDISLLLVNTFRNADNIRLNWKKYDRYGQQLDAGFVFPYVFYLPTGIDLNFELLKKDSSYLNSSFRWNIPYFFSAYNQAGVIIESKKSDILTESIIPGISDYKKNSAGLFMKWNNFDRPVLPRNGFGFEITFKSGIKESESLTDTASPIIRSEIFEQHAEILYCRSLSNVFGIKLNVQDGYLNGSDILLNEQWRLGGFKSMRGFDEESIYAEKFIYGNIELKVFFGEYSNAFTFFNIAGYSRTIPEKINDTPYGFGWGVEVETPAGILSLIYALGSQFNNPVEFRSSKVHISLLNRF